VQTISYTASNSGIFSKTVSPAINKDRGRLIYLFIQAPAVIYMPDLTAKTLIK